jgi:hypothetical protein
VTATRHERAANMPRTGQMLRWQNVVGGCRPVCPQSQAGRHELCASVELAGAPAGHGTPRGRPPGPPWRSKRFGQAGDFPDSMGPAPA